MSFEKGVIRFGMEEDFVFVNEVGVCEGRGVCFGVEEGME